MKRKLFISFIALCLVVAVVCWMGVGYYSSSSAVRDLKAELESIYGTEYTGKIGVQRDDIMRVRNKVFPKRR